MRLTKNFILKEFNCKDGTEVPLSLMANAQLLADNLQVLRDCLEAPIHINSAYRHSEYNSSVGGTSKSQHLLCKAADIRVDSYNPVQIYETIEMLIEEGSMKDGGIGLYNSFVHYDVRGTRARWNFTKQ
jgi:uncharacterized protein YcbK (DUF882 family)